ncbi:DUF3320 domain-containing protein [Chitinophaga silvatica]|uniref:DUF3320 domain-containing protein n=1 Tax=Chitinophaga silvatica TaxID=2282649 RepID=A0A3E1Y6Z1_9BACT|nr:DUF3320 domain-containing protein [Chitinophaga silvatica]RFS20523.1 DUF3320 domain-containing protein [Chitinophaga silvatica]
MIASILTRLESSRKELLDLGLRNPLLNYKLPASKGLHIVEEQSVAIYDILVRENKTMSFLGRSISKQDDNTAVSYNEPVSKEVITDTRLQTNENQISLHTRLLNTYYAARMSIEEQGVNILYLTLGMLQWYEEDNSKEIRQAPILLIPVTLERSNVRERFRLKYSLEEIGGNISLQAKMKATFNLELPDLPETEDIDVQAYFDSIAAAIKGIPHWKVEPDAIELGFFSFGKFLIYNDLDVSNWQNDQDVLTHPVMQGLFGNGFTDTLPTVAETAFLDTNSNAGELFQVLDADSSQIQAMLAVQEGRNLIIQGPPGTGKSQTITNIIADAIGRGKKVLFVAEKLAALEVVKRRLDNIQLGEACLELHSHKANKKELHHELRRVLELGKPTIKQLQEEVQLLDSHRAELNNYCQAINTEIAKSGLTAHQLIGHLLRLNEEVAGVALPLLTIPGIESWDSVTMTRATAVAQRIQACLQQIGLPTALVFKGSKLTVLLPHEQELLAKQLNLLQESLLSLLEAALPIATKIGLAAPAGESGIEELIMLSEWIAQQPDISELDINNKAWIVQASDIAEWLEAGTIATSIRQQYQEILIPEAWEEDVIEIRENLIAHGNKWYKFLIGAYKRSNRRLAALCKQKLPAGNEEKLAYIDAIMEFRRQDATLKANAGLGSTLYGSRWQKFMTDWESLKQSTAYITETYKRVKQEQFPVEIIKYLSQYPSAAIATSDKALLEQMLQAYRQALDTTLSQLQYQKTEFPKPFEIQQLLLQKWISKLPEIHHLIAWNNISETAIQENLAFLLPIAESWTAANQLLKTLLHKTWFEFLIETAVKSQLPLRKFEKGSHESIIADFRKLDQLNLQYNRARAALEHWEHLPPMEAGGQVNILRTEFNKKARHMPLRKLMQEAGLAIQAVKPVFMMSPMSIANFLPPASLEFDMVIFDEASQVRPVDALGAILRGKQLIVVGDNKQLPPTSFFDTLTKDFEDEDNVTADMQSILGLCDAQGAPQRMLRWHYRSRHESLIALSNQEFYENKLVIFPGPGSIDQKGLVFHYLKDAVYDRGKTRTNPKEAEVVADAVMEHAKKYPQMSLGVVAFSTAQRQAITDVLEERRRAQPELEAFFSAHHDEPFFVKNLENVQGDERDVIFISIGYGRTETGAIPMSFGPLNNEGGERRLNVLITRAKSRCAVFTNMTADDIDLSKTKSYGIQSLKSFLYFAQHGKLYIPEESIRPETLPFETHVAAKLEEMGYTVRRQIGSKGCYIDMAIVDPLHPEKYLLGIICDGASYEAPRSARDRDRLRFQVLTAMGWKIYQIWSIDWLRDPVRALQQLVAAIEHERQQGTENNENTIAAEEVAKLTRETVIVPEISIPVYETATLPPAIGQQEFHLHPIGQLCDWVQQIVNVESPVHFDEVARRMVEAAGITRVGPRIREILRHAVRHADASKRIKIKGQFLWDLAMSPPVLRNRSHLPAVARKINYISQEELTLALEKIVGDAIAIQREDAVPMVSKLLGFTRVTEDIKEEVNKVIDVSIEEKVLEQEGDFLKLRLTVA